MIVLRTLCTRGAINGHVLLMVNMLLVSVIAPAFRYKLKDLVPQVSRSNDWP